MSEFEFYKIRFKEHKALSGRGTSCSIKNIKQAGKTDGIFCNIITNQEKGLKGDT